MTTSRMAKPKLYVGMIVGFDSNRHCSWGTSYGHVITKLEGEVATLIKGGDESETCEVDLSTAKGYYNMSRSYVQFD